MPKISVIMPAYNAEKHIAEAIGSILNQTFQDFEFIILNDCSKDGTESVILSYDDERIVYVKNEENLGVARTLNKGLAIARGEYIARMDADDISVPERFEKQVAFLDAHPSVAAVGSNAVLFGEGISEQITDMPLDQKGIRVRMAISNPFIHPTMMLRAAAHPHYDSAFEGREDYRLWMELSQQCGMANLKTPLLRYRIHGSQVTRKRDETRAQKHFLLKKTYYRELDAGLTEEMMEALCHAAFYGAATDKIQLEALKQGLILLADRHHLQSLPGEYATMLLAAGINLGLTAAEKWKLTSGLPMGKRLTALLRRKG